MLLIGSTGFVGRSLRDLLEQSNEVHEIVSVSRSSPDGANHSHIQVDISADLDTDLFPNDVNVIVHAATPASALLNFSDPSEMFRLNIAAMSNVLSIAAACRSAPTVLFPSSGAVYGRLPDEMERFPEGFSGSSSTLDVRSAYSEGKRAAEFLLTEASVRGVCRGIVARLFAFSGIHLPLDRHFALGNFIRDSLEQKPITVRGDGSAVRSYMDCSDMANWLMAAAMRGEPHVCYHIGSETPISVRDLAKLVQARVEKLFGYEPRIDVLGQVSEIDGVDRYVPDTTVTRSLLGVEQKVCLSDSIDGMLLHYKRKNSDQ